MQQRIKETDRPFNAEGLVRSTRINRAVSIGSDARLLGSKIAQPQEVIEGLKIGLLLSQMAGLSFRYRWDHTAPVKADELRALREMCPVGAGRKTMIVTIVSHSMEV